MLAKLESLNVFPSFGQARCLGPGLIGRRRIAVPLHPSISQISKPFLKSVLSWSPRAKCMAADFMPSRSVKY